MVADRDWCGLAMAGSSPAMTGGGESVYSAPGIKRRRLESMDTASAYRPARSAWRGNLLHNVGWPIAEHYDAVGQRHGFSAVMRDKQYRRGTFAPSVQQQITATCG